MNMFQGTYEAGHAVAIVGYKMTTHGSDIGFVKTAGVKGGVKTDILGLNTKIAASEKTGYYFHNVKGNIQPFAPTSPHPALREKQMLTLL